MDKLNFALVTGASSGIGNEFARLLAKKKYNLIITARREDRLISLQQELVSQHDIKIEVIPHDLSLPGSAKELFDKIQQKNLSVSLLINNAGFGMYGEFLDDDFDRLSSMMQLNVVSLTQLAHLFGAKMAEQKSGSILFVSSIGGFQPCPYFAVYSATKSFVLNLGEALYHEFKKRGVHVCTLYPGGTKSEFFDILGKWPSHHHLFSLMPSSRVAEIGIDAVLKKKSSVVIGWDNKLNAFLLKMMPRKWAAAIIGFFSKKIFEEGS